MLPPSRPGRARGSPDVSRREAHQPSGWDRTLSVLERNRVPLKQRRWYVLRAEAFVDAMRPMRMGEVSVEHITAFFPRYAREQRLNEWQYRQTVEAVQLLLVDLAQCRAATEVDWDFCTVAYQPPKITASGISYRSSPMWTMLRSDSLLALKTPLSAWLWS